LSEAVEELKENKDVIRNVARKKAYVCVNSTGGGRWVGKAVTFFEGGGESDWEAKTWKLLDRPVCENRFEEVTKLEG